MALELFAISPNLALDLFVISPDLALEFAQAHLKPEGSLLVKCFHGSGYSQIVEKFKRQFKVVASRKPKASRDKSSETFILGRYLKSVD